MFSIGVDSQRIAETSLKPCAFRSATFPFVCPGRWPMVMIFVLRVNCTDSVYYVRRFHC